MNDTTETTTVFEIRVRAADSTAWVTLEEKPITIESARDLAAFKALRQTPIPAEVLAVWEWGPVDRWLDGRRAALESLTPGHPGGCACGECVVRWNHQEGTPGHEPCAHGVCQLCGPYCQDCADAEHGQYIETLVGLLVKHINQAGNELAQAQKTLRELTSNEVYDIELAEGSDGTDALADLEDAARALRRAQRIIRYRQRLLDEAG